MNGFTKEEIFLNKIGLNSFLQFWSWPNLFRDQGSANGKGDGKEICDLTVIFGNDVLLFSDKKIVFNQNKEINVAWSRWARRAIGDSIKQIKGARRWISEYPERVYLDSGCQKQIPISIPEKQNIKFHNIVVCHGIEDVLSKLNNEASFFIDNSIHGKDHWDKDNCKPFCIGQIFEGSFVHIFNESTIELVLKEFDTAKDFLSYIKQRELLLNSSQLVRATSESDIIQLHYENFDEKKEHQLSILPKNMQDMDTITINRGGIDTLHCNPHFIAKKYEDEVSYFWDGLIEQFSSHTLNGTIEHENWHTVKEVEPGARQLATPSRFGRRILATSFITFYNKVAPKQRGTRLCMDPSNQNSAYLFFILPFTNKSHEKYQELRRNMLLDYCLINKFLNPDIENIIGIACKTREFEQPSVLTDNFFDEGQDFVFIDLKDWSDKENIKAKHLHDQYVSKRWLGRKTSYMKNISEFPQ